MKLTLVLVLLCGKLFGESNPGLVRMAAVMEMIHTATLVHDDVIDMAKTRRGRPSINVVWGNHTSVLAGDWLCDPAPMRRDLDLPEPTPLEDGLRKTAAWYRKNGWIPA